MSVKYKIKQFINPTSAVNGFYYARATMVGQRDLNSIAEIIQQNCSMKKSDVMAVLTELVDVMTDTLQNSMAVKINGFGTFKMALHSTMAQKVEDFNSTYINRIKVNFLPEYTRRRDGSPVYKLIAGATVEKYNEYLDGTNDNQMEK